MNTLFNRLSDPAKIALLAVGLIISGTALNTAWSAAIYPDKQDTAAYMQEIKTETAGGAIGFSLAAFGGLLAGGAFRRKTAKISP